MRRRLCCSSRTTGRQYRVLHGTPFGRDRRERRRSRSTTLSAGASMLAMGSPCSTRSPPPRRPPRPLRVRQHCPEHRSPPTTTHQRHRQELRRAAGWAGCRRDPTRRAADFIANQAEMTTIGGPSTTVAITTSHPSGCPNMSVSLSGSESSQGSIQKRPSAYNTLKASRAPPAAPTATKTPEPIFDPVRFSNGRLTSLHRLGITNLKLYSSCLRSGCDAPHDG